MKKIITFVLLTLTVCCQTMAASDVELTYANALQMYWDGGIAVPADGRLNLASWNGIRWAKLNLSTQNYDRVTFSFLEGLPANLSFEVYYTDDDEGTNKTQVDPAEGDQTVTLMLDGNKIISTIYIKTRDAAATIHLDKGVVKVRPENTGLPTDVVVPDGWQTATEAVAQMTTGLNIGNTLDSYGSWLTGSNPKTYETGWGNPQITLQLIQAMKQGGFNAVRLPVTWYQNILSDGIVRESWMNRVQQVVDYIIGEGMYCILNVHHDTGAGIEAWLKADLTNIDAISAKMTSLWTQIATRFRDYGDHLIFEGYNEMLDQDNHWTMTTANGYAAHNQLAQVFVNTVRSTGGSNAYRSLLVNTYSADPGQYTASRFVVPTDCVEEQLIVGAHVYAPGSFTSQGDDAEAPVWTDAMAQELTSVLQSLRDVFPNTPVVIGEFGANSRAIESEAAKYAKVFIEKSVELGLGRFYWFDIINRKTYEWTMALLKASLLGYENETGIQSYEYEATPNHRAVYNLRGQKVAESFTNQLPKDIYIVGGRKIIQN